MGNTEYLTKARTRESQLFQLEFDPSLQVSNGKSTQL